MGYRRRRRRCPLAVAAIADAAKGLTIATATGFTIATAKGNTIAIAAVASKSPSSACTQVSGAVLP